MLLLQLFFFILAASSAFDGTLLNYAFFSSLKVAILLWHSNAEFLSTALIESVRLKGFDGLALLGKYVCMRPHISIFLVLLSLRVYEEGL